MAVIIETLEFTRTVWVGKHASHVYDIFFQVFRFPDFQTFRFPVTMTLLGHVINHVAEHWTNHVTNITRFQSPKRPEVFIRPPNEASVVLTQLSHRPKDFSDFSRSIRMTFWMRTHLGLPKTQAPKKSGHQKLPASTFVYLCLCISAFVYIYSCDIYICVYLHICISTFVYMYVCVYQHL